MSRLYTRCLRSPCSHLFPISSVATGPLSLSSPPKTRVFWFFGSETFSPFLPQASENSSRALLIRAPFIFPSVLERGIPPFFPKRVPSFPYCRQEPSLLWGAVHFSHDLVPLCLLGLNPKFFSSFLPDESYAKCRKPNCCTLVSSPVLKSSPLFFLASDIHLLFSPHYLKYQTNSTG